ncbi:MAG: hypothetical protein GY795_01095 [Desulfobacterales bacterium]|nr:hypothetical protein [Desulfobacterales bacterium]
MPPARRNTLPWFSHDNQTILGFLESHMDLSLRHLDRLGINSVEAESTMGDFSHDTL